LDLGLSFLIQLDLAIALIFCDVGLTHFIQWDPLCNFSVIRNCCFVIGNFCLFISCEVELKSFIQWDLVSAFASQLGPHTKMSALSDLFKAE
jgi:hypothetical protein